MTCSMRRQAIRNHDIDYAYYNKWVLGHEKNFKQQWNDRQKCKYIIVYLKLIQWSCPDRLSGYPILSRVTTCKKHNTALGLMDVY